MALAHDFPRLWQNPQTPDRERKRLVRLVLDDVTLIQNEGITAHVRFKGGITENSRGAATPQLLGREKDPDRSGDRDRPLAGSPH